MALRYFQAHETSRYDELDGLPLATFAQRAVGFVVDFLVVIVLWMPVELFWARFISQKWDGAGNHHIDFTFHEWRSLLAAMLYYVVVNYLSNGRSLGKWITGTRIVSLVHERLGIWQCVERVLGYGVSLGEGIDDGDLDQLSELVEGL
jgi:uncharacterized RDD family membrane protein YckC